MAQRFSLWGMLGLDTSGYSTGLNNARQSTQGFVNSTQGMSADITRAFRDISTMGIGEMRRNLRELRNISFTGRTVEEIAAVNRQIGLLTDEMADLNSMQRNMGVEFGSLMASGLQAVAAVGQMGFGLATMFGASEESAAEYQQTMTSMIGVMQGFAVVQDAIGNRIFQAIALRIRETAVTVAQTVATQAQTAAQWLLNASLLTMMATIGAVVIVVAALAAGIYYLVGSHKEATKAAEEQEAAEEQLNRTIEDGKLVNEQMLKMAKARGASATELKQLELGSTYSTLQALTKKYNTQTALINNGKKLSKEEQKIREDELKQINSLDNSLEVMKVELEMLGKTSKKVSTKMVQDVKEVKDAWVLAYEKQQELAQYDVPQRSGIETDMTSMGSKGVIDTYKPITDAFLTSLKERHEASMKFYEEEISAAAKAASELVAIENETKDFKLRVAEQAFGDLASLFTENTIAYKVMAIAQATIATYLAGVQVLAARAALGPVIAGLAMAGVIASGLATVAKIAGVGFENGGIVGGSSISGDRIPIRVNSKEMILNQGQQANLFAMANGYGGSGGELTTRISGNDLLVVLNRTGKKINNTK